MWPKFFLNLTAVYENCNSVSYKKTEIRNIVKPRNWANFAESSHAIILQSDEKQKFISFVDQIAP